jgi:hypothetical protein
VHSQANRNRFYFAPDETSRPSFDRQRRNTTKLHGAAVSLDLLEGRHVQSSTHIVANNNDPSQLFGSNELRDHDGRSSAVDSVDKFDAVASEFSATWSACLVHNDSLATHSIHARISVTEFTRTIDEEITSLSAVNKLIFILLITCKSTTREFELQSITSQIRTKIEPAVSWNVCLWK